MKNKKLTIVLITILSIITLVLSVFFIGGMFKHTRFGFMHIVNLNHKVSNNLALEKEYEDDFNDINLDIKVGDIEIYNGNQNEVKVRYYGNEDDITINKENTKLNIVSKNKVCIGICFSATIPKVEVYLPNTYDKKVTITNDYGDIDIGEFKNMDLNITSSAGDIKILAIKKGSLTNDFGDINIIKSSEVLNITQNFGDITIGEVESIKIENKLGDTAIDYVKDSIDITSELGDISIEKAELHQNSSIDNKLGDVSINNVNDINIQAKTQLGETDIKENDNNAKIKLTIKNSLGDIIVK